MNRSKVGSASRNYLNTKNINYAFAVESRFLASDASKYFFVVIQVVALSLYEV
jgi:hypothetical protein